MPIVPAAKGVIIATSIIFAATVAIYENEHVREWIDRTGHNLFIALDDFVEQLVDPEARRRQRLRQRGIVLGATYAGHGAGRNSGTRSPETTLERQQTGRIARRRLYETASGNEDEGATTTARERAGQQPQGVSRRDGASTRPIHSDEGGGMEEEERPSTGVQNEAEDIALQAEPIATANVANSEVLFQQPSSSEPTMSHTFSAGIVGTAISDDLASLTEQELMDFTDPEVGSSDLDRHPLLSEVAVPAFSASFVDIDHPVLPSASTPLSSPVPAPVVEVAQPVCNVPNTSFYNIPVQDGYSSQPSAPAQPSDASPAQHLHDIPVQSAIIIGRSDSFSSDSDTASLSNSVSFIHTPRSASPSSVRGTLTPQHSEGEVLDAEDFDIETMSDVGTDTASHVSASENDHEESASESGVSRASWSDVASRDGSESDGWTSAHG